MGARSTVKRTWRALPDVSSAVFAPPAYGGRIGNILCAKREAIIQLSRFMEGSTAADTTQLLRAWADGDSGALEQLTPRVYRELRHLAARLLRNERPGYTLQSTDLVHEVYLRLVNAEELDWQHRAHFFAIAATLMRRILLDRARRKAAAKRGGRPQPLDVSKAVDIAQARARELVCLDDALDALSAVDPRKARIVELRFFGGLSVKETAEVVRVSPDTVLRDWKIARAWLLAELNSAA